MTDVLVTHYRGDNWTTSNLVAEKLGKNHQHVLEKIRKLLKNLDELTGQTLPVIATKNIGVKSTVETSTIINTKRKIVNTSRVEKFVREKYMAENGHEYERYRMNKPAFSLLVMQMSGKEALKIQHSFNTAFYEMERYILKKENIEFVAAREQGKIARAEVTDAIQDFVEYATKQGSTKAKFYYSTITKETYKALGFLAAGEKVGSEFRNHLDNFQLAELFIAETLAARSIEKGIIEQLDYHEIYYNAKQKVCEFGRAQQSLMLT